MRCFLFQTFLCSFQGSSLNISFPWTHAHRMIKSSIFSTRLAPGNETRLESCSLYGSRRASVSHTKSLISPCVFKGLLDGG